LFDAREHIKRLSEKIEKVSRDRDELEGERKMLLNNIIGLE